MVKCVQLFSLQLHQDGQQIRQLQLHPKLIRDAVCVGEFRDRFHYLLPQWQSKPVLIHMLEECWDSAG